MKQKDRKLLAISFFFIIAFLIFLAWAKNEIYFPQNRESGKEIIFQIKKGQGAKEIGDNLKKEGIIKYSFFFQLYVMTKRITDKLQAGNYLLSDAMTIPEIANKMAQGQLIKKRFFILEGWNLTDIAKNLEAQGIIESQNFFEIAGEPKKKLELQKIQATKELSKEFNFLADKPSDFNLEGYIFPDTYEIAPGEDGKEIIKKILANLDKKLTPELRKKIRFQGKSIFEIITIASLIEKEVKTLEDKKIVSGVLWERLKIKMPLQVDAAISYITGKNDRRISIEETKIDSPYNTYKYKGLPQGPISNPGMESILAAIEPQKSSYLYYLSTRDGRTIFSRSFEEHKEAKTKYLSR